jgi:hypothetical protein
MRSRNASDASIRFVYFHRYARLSQRDIFADKKPGSAVITHISDDGIMAEGVVIDEFARDSLTHSPQLQHNLRVIPSNASLLSVSNADSWNPEDFIVNFIPVTLVLEGSVTPYNGWRRNDVGKTVMFEYGSILLSNLINRTHIQAHVVKLPSYGVTFAASGSWELYNVQGVYEFAESYNQTLTISSPDSNNIVTATLSSGNGEFDKYCK